MKVIIIVKKEDGMFIEHTISDVMMIQDWNDYIALISLHFKEKKQRFDKKEVAEIEVRLES